jgi:group I intron endonuclease
MEVVYRISSPSTGRYYIGSTRRFSRRRSDHFSALRRKAHENPRLQREWDKYGGLEMSVVAQPLPGASLEDLEQQMIDDALASGLALNVSRSVLQPMLGAKHSEETKKAMAFLKRGKKLSPEQREQRRLQLAALPNPMQGRKQTEETKALISQKLRQTYINGRKHTRHTPSAEHRAALAARMRLTKPRQGKGMRVWGFKEGVWRVWETTIACAQELEMPPCYGSRYAKNGREVRGWLLSYSEEELNAKVADRLKRLLDASVVAEAGGTPSPVDVALAGSDGALVRKDTP